MKISLIENGLDSLKKGYEHLKDYENLKESKSKDADRFSSLKDSILSIQHGIEILFKFLLIKNNELLLFSEINAKVKEAFKKRRAGEIKELFEIDGLHTVTFKESIERVNDICGVLVDEKLKNSLLKVERWRNSIIHSAVVLNEDEVSNILLDLMKKLDSFFGPAIGDQYLKGQGRQELERAYRLFTAMHGKHKNSIKETVVQRLITALNKNNIKNVTSPGAFIIKDPKKAFSILQEMQGDGIVYGCDMINLHCSGTAKITNLSQTNIINISCDDNNSDYQLRLDGIVAYVPPIEDSTSPLIYIYSEELEEKGSNPEITKDKNFKTQNGILDLGTKKQFWEKEELNKIYRKEEDLEHSCNLRGITRFLSKGCACFLNIQKLKYGEAKKLMLSGEYTDINKLHKGFIDHFNRIQQSKEL